MRQNAIIFALTAAGCAPAPASSPSGAPAPSAPAPDIAVAEPDAAAPTDKARPELAPAVKLLDFERVHEAAVHSLALGEKSRVAALGSDAWLDRGKGLEKLPPVPKPTQDVQIYFGRDNLPRLMGFVRSADGVESVYFRFRGGWERAATELGRLGSASGALYGVLGHADPEVVCKPGEQCIIKRRSGWTTIAPLPGLPRVTLCNGQPWAFERDAVFSLASSVWQPLGGPKPFAEVSGLWATSASDVWVAESTKKLLHHFDGSAWTKHDSPIEGPRALWAASANEIWLAGEGGLARYDGKVWTRVAGAPERASVIAGAGSNDLWIGGASGVWHGERAKR